MYDVARLRRAGGMAGDLALYTSIIQIVISVSIKTRDAATRLELDRRPPVGGAAGRVAADVRRQYRDGVWLVELAAVEDPRLVPRTVAAALGLREHSTQSPMIRLRDYLLDKRLLLVLDNCEHMLDACADLASRLMRE